MHTPDTEMSETPDGTRDLSGAAMTSSQDRSTMRAGTQQYGL